MAGAAVEDAGVGEGALAGTGIAGIAALPFNEAKLNILLGLYVAFDSSSCCHKF